MAKKAKISVWSPAKIKITGCTYFYPELMKDPKTGKIKPTGSIYMYPEATGTISPKLKKVLEKLVLY